MMVNVGRTSHAKTHLIVKSQRRDPARGRAGFVGIVPRRQLAVDRGFYRRPRSAAPAPKALPGSRVPRHLIENLCSKKSRL
jgi:hypothetical protein